MSKCDPELGRLVNHHLETMGVETPMEPYGGEGVTPSQQMVVIEDAFTRIMRIMNLDLRDDSLMDTPKRVAKMYVNEIFSGLNYDNFPKCTAVDNKMKYDEMVIEKNITCISACEHHFVTIDQICHIAYVPNKKVLGLSKLNRIAKFFAQRPQIQERFVEQVYHALQYILETDNIAVVAEGRHYCVAQRGVEDQTSRTITSKLGGGFKNDPALRAEFMSLIK